jgi:hypothetical protein
MTDEQRARKNANDRKRRAKLKAQREQLAATMDARSRINGGINPATKLPHTARFIAPMGDVLAATR